MNALIVGGDRVHAIREELEKVAPAPGALRVEHWPGRKPGYSRRSVSAGTRVIVFVCRHLSHSLMLHVRRQADDLGVPVVYLRRSDIGWQAELQNLRERLAD
ncbi:DUF2325 domain-containing protein [Rhodocyclus tenuis]|uniref:DUF2325 domain-containing protein n=2 Tax=Rhodocyclus TaxID=1064 RepID=A0A6L5K025_RHOTE|nr:DUF2325 domain-containing protein [Rhodocyclus gracilis]MQY52706.1 DUF2325 domain-containing protein [Rhodocyclus gracilis]MRD72773.1 DUF2325 domain-containing protein [Rhodocyclus gracilis]NJA90161.1 DUF2325 domain-containing protein [Rhodocyclus gracilis]